jgi:hypothetical protein
MAKAFNLSKKIKVAQSQNPRPPKSMNCKKCNTKLPIIDEDVNNCPQWGKETGEHFSATKPYNLSKIAQGIMPPIDPMGLNDSPELNEPIDQSEANQIPEGTPQFKDGSDLKDWLDNQIQNGTNIDQTREQLFNMVDINNQQPMEEYLKQYYQGNITDNDKVELATSMFKMLVQGAKIEDINDPSLVPAQFSKAFVEEVNNTIKAMATKAGLAKRASVKPYNLSKIAQHKGFDNVIMFGPNQMKVDPFYRQPVSNYALLERNKGFGLVVDDIWDIDYETIWRSTIMDKFSRPYRDKEGNWVGGYIQKRFEVDKNIPIVNNMQLKPGQKRKPILPEYGLIEGRMELQREKEAKKIASVKPFNLKQAMADKKKSELKTSQLKPLPELRMPGEPKPATWGRVCKGCGGTLASFDPTQDNNSDYCFNCQKAGRANQAGSQPTGANKRRPNKPGEINTNPFSANNPMSIQPGQQIAAEADTSIKLSSLSYKKDKKDDKRVNDNFMSDDFKMCPNIQKSKQPVQYVDNSINEITKSCEDLAIDD